MAGYEAGSAPTALEIKIGDHSVAVTGEPGLDLKLATENAKFLAWSETIGKDKNFMIKGIHFQSIDMFGKNIGFMKFKADAEAGGKFCPGIVFMRGGAPAILVILKRNSDGMLFTVTVNQPRLPVGYSSFAEIPAGMLNADGCFTGVAAKELKEETGIEINEKDLINMSALAHEGHTYNGMYPSCGGSDEYNPLFLYRREVDPEFIDRLQGKKAGVVNEEEGDFEQITVKVVPLDDLWKISSDGKALSAICLYDRLTACEKLPAF